MDFRLNEQEEAFREEVCSFFEAEFPPDFLRALEAEPPQERKLYRECVRRLASKGWIGIGWPREYGGMERSFTEQLVYSIEMYLRIPAKVINPLGVAASLAAPVIMSSGSEELKARFVPRILKGEATFCLGYSEPSAGSDLVGLQTIAVADGDDYVINGQKAFTSSAEYADYCWLSARTDPDAPKKSRGISLFIVDMKTPGITWREVPTMSGKYSVNDLFLKDVRVPRSNIVGEENQGWTYVTQALSQERLGFGVQAAVLKRGFDELLAYVGERRGNGRSTTLSPVLRHKLAQTAVELEVARLFAARLVWMAEKGENPFLEASMAKVLVTQLEQRLSNMGMQILGLWGQLERSCEPAPLNGRIPAEYKHSIMASVGGGSTEIQKMIIATIGLGLPRG